MTIELTQKSQEIIDRAIRAGGFHDPNEVVGAALERLAEDIDDVAVAKAREPEPRYRLEEKNLVELFAQSPFKGLNIEFDESEEDKDFGRDIEL